MIHTGWKQMSAKQRCKEQAIWTDTENCKINMNTSLLVFWVCLFVYFYICVLFLFIPLFACGFEGGAQLRILDRVSQGQ